MAKKIGNISALEFALSHILDEPQREDEFSAEDAYLEARQKNPKITLSSVRQRLTRMEQNGSLKKRSVRHNGTIVNLFSKA
jgi:hypothetical protein